MQDARRRRAFAQPEGQGVEEVAAARAAAVGRKHEHRRTVARHPRTAPEGGRRLEVVFVVEVVEFESGRASWSQVPSRPPCLSSGRQELYKMRQASSSSSLIPLAFAATARTEENAAGAARAFHLPAAASAVPPADDLLGELGERPDVGRAQPARPLH